MDFDNAKENIQPLASGRNVSLLQASLSQDATQELSAQRKQLELEIKNYNGNDPLQAWYNYICWIEQSYPAGGSNCGLQKVMQKCLTQFEQDERYKQDRRFIKLFIKFMHEQGDQLECYQQMYDNGIGTMLADFYIAWAYSYDLSGNMRKANEIFRLGVDCRAEPLEDLKEAQHHFGYAVAQRMLYSPTDEETTAVTQELYNRRRALCSLQGQKQRNNTVNVGSIRTGAAIKKNTPGILHSDAPSTSRASRNAGRQHEVFNDENADMNRPPPGSAVSETPATSAEAGKSSLRSIIDAAREQENLKEPIAWSKPHKHGKIFGANAGHDLAFPIHVDDKKLPPITDYERNFDKPFKYPPNWVSKNTPQKLMVTPVTIEQELDSNTLPFYNKVMLYPRPNMEFSTEEYRAYCWFKRRNENHPYVLANAEWWSNGSAYNVRRYPNFASKSKPQPRDEQDGYRKLSVEASLKSMLDKIYNDEEQQEYQLDELLAVKWRLTKKSNLTVHCAMDMEETVCLPGEQMPRRKSFFPAAHTGSERAPDLPSVSCVIEEEEEEEEQQAAINIWTDPEPVISARFAVLAAAAPPSPAPSPAPAAVPAAVPVPAATAVPARATAAVSDPDPVVNLAPAPAPTPAAEARFMMPALPAARKIEIYEDDEDAMPPPPALVKPSPFFDADETCSTQQFNIFIKSQAVSTPKATQKQAPVRQFGTLLRDAPPAAPIDELLAECSPEVVPLTTVPVSPMLRKQLSTILETSEHGTHGSSGATKFGANTSPGSSMQSTPGPTRLQRQLAELSVVGEESERVAGNFERLELWEPNAPSVPLMKSIRFQEDKTETVTRPLLPRYPEEKTETMPRLPLLLPAADASLLLQPPALPQMPTDFDDDDMCGLFAKSPPKPYGREQPLKKSSSQIFGDKPSQSKSNIINLADSFMTDLSFVPETQPMKTQNQTREQPADLSKRLEHWEQEAPSVLLKSLRFQEDNTDTLPKTKSYGSPLLAATNKKLCPQGTPVMNSQSEQQKNSFVVFANEKNSFKGVSQPAAAKSSSKPSYMLADLSFVPETQPISAQAAANPIEIYLDESMPLPPAANPIEIYLDESLPLPPAVPSMINFTLPETQPEQQQLPKSVEKLETIGPAHLTASFMKDCTELSKCPTPLSTTNKSRLLQNEVASAAKSTEIAKCNQSNDYFELNAATEMFASNLSMIKNSTLLPKQQSQQLKKRSRSPVQEMQQEQAAEVALIADKDKVHEPGSIYYKKTPLTPKLSRHSWHDSHLSTPKQDYEHIRANLDESLLNSTLASAKVNPFCQDIIRSLLDSIEFSLYIEKLPNCQLVGHVKPLTTKTHIEVQGEKFDVNKIIGKGAYGVIYNGIHKKSGKKVALKQEKPTNYWEFYICLEVHSRLASEKMIPAYMNIDYALVGNNSSVYISELSDYGSLICVCNKFNKHTNKNLDEYVVMHLCCQLLDIVDHLHALGIIHADIKADNFLLMKTLSIQPNDLSLQLIDFGVAIDTKLFPPNQTFDYVHKDETFNCIEMRTKRRWTYQLDLYGLVGVMHVLLFGRYMEVTERQPNIWMPKTALPRYFNRQVWESIFRTLLNVRDCRTMPNLQQLRAMLKSELAEKEKYVEAAIARFNMILQRSK